MQSHENNYVVGRGRLFFGQFKPRTRQLKSGQRYLGNTPELSLSQSEDQLDHYSSEGGIRIKDASVTLQQDSSGMFMCDDISPDNLALWFLGEVLSRIEAGSARASGTITFSTAAPAEGDTVTINGTVFTFSDTAGINTISPLPASFGDAATALVAAVTAASTALGVTASAAAGAVTITAIAAGTDGNAITIATDFDTPANATASGATLTGGVDVSETFNDIERGRWYQLGVGPATPQGVRNVGSVSIAALDDDSYTVEAATGRVLIHADAPDIADGGSFTVTYGVSATVETVVVSKGATIEGELQFLANNPAGQNDDYFWPYVRLTPDGDFSLKGDEWQTVTFNFEVMKRDDATERQYITRR